jgi:hypothetical protein
MSEGERKKERKKFQLIEGAGGWYNKTIPAP